MSTKLICVGASAGGIHALQELFMSIGEPLGPAMIVVQHLPEYANVDLNLVFGRFTKAKLVEVMDKMPLEPGVIFFAPSGYHVHIEREGYFSLSYDEPVHHSRPSIDVLFESAAWAFGKDACGVILTGANSDGANGLSEIARAGGLTFVQDVKEAEVSAMPLAAIEKAKPQWILPLAEIGRALRELSNAGVAV